VQAAPAAAEVQAPPVQGPPDPALVDQLAAVTRQRDAAQAALAVEQARPDTAAQTDCQIRAVLSVMAAAFSTVGGLVPASQVCTLQAVLRGVNNQLRIQLPQHLDMFIEECGRPAFPMIAERAVPSPTHSSPTAGGEEASQSQASTSQASQTQPNLFPFVPLRPTP